MNFANNVHENDINDILPIEGITKAILALRNLSQYDDLVMNLTKELCEELMKLPVVNGVRRYMKICYESNGLIRIGNEYAIYNIIGTPWEEPEKKIIEKKKQLESYSPYQQINYLWYCQIQDYYKRPIKKISYFYKHGDYIDNNSLAWVEMFKFIELSLKITNNGNPLKNWNSEFKIPNLEYKLKWERIEYIVNAIIRNFFYITSPYYSHDNFEFSPGKFQPNLYLLSEDEIKYLAEIAKINKFTATSYIHYNKDIVKFIKRKIVCLDYKIEIKNLKIIMEVHNNYYIKRKTTPFEYIQMVIEFYKTLDEFSKLYPNVRKYFIKLGIIKEGYMPEIKIPNDKIISTPEEIKETIKTHENKCHNYDEIIGEHCNVENINKDLHIDDVDFEIKDCIDI